MKRIVLCWVVFVLRERERQRERDFVCLFAMASAAAAAAAVAMPIEGMDVWAANNRKSFGLGGGGGSEHNAMMFSRRNSAQSRRGGVGDHHEIDDDEEALKWAALEKLPTYDRLRTSILQKFLGSKVVHEEVDVRHIGFAERQRIIDNLLKVADEDNERFLLKLRHRIDRYPKP